MQTVAKNNFVLKGSSSLKGLAGLPKASRQAEFYQQVITSITKGIRRKHIETEVGNRLIALAEQSYALRQMDIVWQASSFLLALIGYEDIGRYYGALCLHQSKRFAEAGTALESLVDKLPPAFRSKSLVALSATFGERGDFQSFLSLCVEAGKASVSHSCYDPQAFITSQRNIAVFKSIHGDHRRASNDLEKMLPFAYSIGRQQPYLLYEHLNSLAVEYTEIGRLHEAGNLSQIVLASPFAFAYPEWRETRQELALRGYKSRSSVPVTQSFFIPKKIQNVLNLPERERLESTRRSPFFQPGEVTSLKDWKNKMVKEPNGDNGDEKNLDEMNDKDLFMELMRVASDDFITSKKLRKMVDAIKKIASEKD